MKTWTLYLAITVALVVTIGAGSGCGFVPPCCRHEVTPPVPGVAMNCKLCYDEAVMISRSSPKGISWQMNQIIRKHVCPGCSTEVTLYTQEGKPMIKCPKCAPEGLACDRCLPPK